MCSSATVKTKRWRGFPSSSELKSMGLPTNVRVCDVVAPTIPDHKPGPSIIRTSPNYTSRQGQRGGTVCNPATTKAKTKTKPRIKVRFGGGPPSVKYRSDFPFIIDTVDVMPKNTPRKDWVRCLSPARYSIGNAIPAEDHIPKPNAYIRACREANAVRRAMSISYEAETLCGSPLVIIWTDAVAMMLPYKGLPPVQRTDKTIVESYAFRHHRVTDAKRLDRNEALCKFRKQLRKLPFWLCPNRGGDGEMGNHFIRMENPQACSPPKN